MVCVFLLCVCVRDREVVSVFGCVYVCVMCVCVCFLWCLESGVLCECVWCVYMCFFVFVCVVCVIC